MNNLTNGSYGNDSTESSSKTESDSGSCTPASITTTLTTVSSSVAEVGSKLGDLGKYIALGSLHYDQDIDAILSAQLPQSRDKYIAPPASDLDWPELIHPGLPKEVQDIIGNEATRLLEARWLRLFLHLSASSPQHAHSIVRVYLLPEDRGRRFIDRNSKSLKAALRYLLEKIDVSPQAWYGDHSAAAIQHFDPWASVENRSLFYLFNRLPSPAPEPRKIKSRFSRRAVESLLYSAKLISPDEELPIEALKTKLYPYQARTASLMIQREAAPQLNLDPRLEVRKSPNGETFYFGARDGSFLREPRYYETNRGGILAETMGLGKTIICLSVILSTRGHLPQIPPAYQPPPPIRDRVGSLKNMAASIISRYAIPAKDALERREADEEVELNNHKEALRRNIAHYEIPPDLPRMNRSTRIPPPRQLVTCSGTIIVVPRNLLHQWQSEIRKHVALGSLRILVVDTAPKRGKVKTPAPGQDAVEFCSELPAPTDLMEYDIVLFTRNRFEQEIQDGADEKGRRSWAGAPLSCRCPYIGSSRIPDCSCTGDVYESPLKKIHWLRIIIDEGHNFSSSVSNAVLVAKQLQAERRWVVSGTPAKSLVGVEMDLLATEEESLDQAFLRETTIEQRKTFNLDDENTKAAKALGSLASNFLMVRPWSDSSSEGRLDWDEYIYRHEHQYRKTYSGFSLCFLRTLEGLVVKTRPEDVEKDIVLPPMKHRVVYLKPCWFDKMTANLFVQVLRANAITSERSDVDYLFHKNSIKARHNLIRNLRQSNFTWTGFRLDDVVSTLETSQRYLDKGEKQCSLKDANLLLESSSMVAQLATSESWIALSKAHEVGMAVENFPQNSEESFSLAYPHRPTMVGITQLLDGQLHVDSHILTGNPSEGLDVVGQAAKARIAAIAEAEDETKESKEKVTGDAQLKKAGVPSSCVGLQPVTSRRTSSIMKETAEPTTSSADFYEDKTVSPIRPRKRKLTLSDELAELPEDSPLRETRVIGTTSAKLSYLITKVMKHQATEKIIIFYDGDNAAFYIAQCLEMLYVNHRIYARTLDNTKRSEYIALFNENPDIRVLLIDVACGALGLNLNAASVVLIVNPINRPDIEAQAIKRAHRIGQTKEVLVETLVLEGTMEEAIFKHAKKMSRQQFLEAKELEDDAGIVDIIQNAEVLPIEPGESEGFGKFAPLDVPQQVFGRKRRERYHRFGVATEAKEKAEGREKPKKKAKASGSKLKKDALKNGKAGASDGACGRDQRFVMENSQGITQPPQVASAAAADTFMSGGFGGVGGGSLFFG
ncbi:hypothetical protein CC80DRAFT_425642 [Byssothecium circinans]|uniref:Helicase C-terminal domain-containing protein n=1 Tax=Byssothecium circinans TaxID=147558 RepID=A0A6A5TFC1_9PLEO|nr:hypothetical protein CC80DRAFT_425642 [Byssothecium circinans]